MIYFFIIGFAILLNSVLCCDLIHLLFLISFEYSYILFVEYLHSSS
jgi:hypothetical protein